MIYADGKHDVKKIVDSLKIETEDFYVYFDKKERY